MLKGFRFFAAFSFVLATLFLLSCSPRSSAPNPFLVLKLGGEPSVLNPLLSIDTASSAVIGLVYNGLLRVDESLNYVPDLAASYTVSEDGLRYTFYLKKNVKWHDGVPFTAQDVVFTVQTLLDPKTQTVRRNLFIVDGKPIQVKALDSYTVEFILPKPFAPFLSNVGISIIPEHLYKNVSVNTVSFNRAPVGTGPFKFSEWKSGQFVKLIRNESYFDGPVLLKGVLFKIIPDQNTSLVALEKQEIDQSNIPPREVDRFKKEATISVFNYHELMYVYLAFNLKHPFLSDLRVRQALAHALPKDALVKSVLRGYGVSANIPTSPLLWDYPDPSHIPIFDFNPAQSHALLTEAGFVKNAQGIYAKNGKPFVFTLLTSKGNPEREKSAQIIQRAFGDIGVKVDLQIMEWSSLLKIVNSPKDPKPFDAVLLGWSLSLDPDCYSIWHSSQYPQGFNFIGYQNAEVDRLLEAGRLEVKQENRKRIYGDIYQHIAADVPYLFLFYPESIAGVNKRVQGLSKPGPAGLFNRIEQVHVVE